MGRSISAGSVGFCAPLSEVDSDLGVRMDRGRQSPWRDGQRGVAVRGRLPHVSSSFERHKDPFLPPFTPLSITQDVSRPQNYEGLCQAQTMDQVHARTSIHLSICRFYGNTSSVLFRKCKITVRGPWKQVPPIRLSDISIMPCLAQSRMEQVPVWAISDKGDVLCRLGVTPQNPAVRGQSSNPLGSSGFLSGISHLPCV